MTHLGTLSPHTDPVAADAEPPDLDTFDWYGETFAVAERLSALAVLKYAWASRQAELLARRAGIDRKRAQSDEAREAADELDAAGTRDHMAALYDFLRGVLAPGEWDRFEEVTTLAAAPEDVLIGLVQELIGVIGARPTRQPSASAGGPSTNTAGSAGSSSAVGSEKARQDAELFHAALAV